MDVIELQSQLDLFFFLLYRLNFSNSTWLRHRMFPLITACYHQICFLRISHSPLCPEKGFPVVLIPWVVLQELDSLKKGKGLSVSSVAHLAIPAISFILDSLKSRGPRLWGQSMQQASQSNSEWRFWRTFAFCHGQTLNGRVF